MSSRSLAAARARRAGENAPPVSGNRPGTSIGSHAAFAPQQQMPPGYNHNMQPNNVRTGRPGQQQPQQQQKQSNKPVLPFTKLSISDAIGLVTLRLGRVEQWIIDTEHEGAENYGNSDSKVPENSKIIDSSILNNIISRLDSLEKRETGVSNVDVSSLSENVSKLNEQLTRIGDEGIKHNLAIAKHTEQLFKFERELVETKDILKTFMIKYDMFANETNNKFADYELALSELEKNVNPVIENGTDSNETETNNEENDNDNNNDNNDTDNNTEVSNIMSYDLKNIIKQELASNI